VLPVDAPPPGHDLAAGGPPALPLPAPAPEKSALAFFLLVLALYATLGTLAQARSRLFGFAWSETFTLLVPSLAVAAGSNLRPGRALLLARRPRAAALALALLVGAASSFGADALMALEALVLPSRFVAAFDLSSLFTSGSPFSRVALALGAAVLAPFCEEAAFRGWVLCALRSRHRDKAAVAASALFFAVMHLDPVRLPALLALGALYGWLCLRAGSLWPSFLAHFANNALGVVLIVASRPHLPPPAGAGAAEASTAALVLLASASALYPLLVAYRRATPSPPPPLSEALVRADPADPSTDFRFERLPRSLLVAMVAGAAALALLLARPS